MQNMKNTKYKKYKIRRIQNTKNTKYEKYKMRKIQIMKSEFVLYTKSYALSPFAIKCIQPEPYSAYINDSYILLLYSFLCEF